MENLRIDENSRWTLGGVANDGSGDIKNARVNPITGALIVEATVTSTNTQIGSTIPGGTAGSVLFLGLGGTLAQDNANFFYDDTNNYLGLGTTTPSATLDVQGTAIITGSAGTPTFVLGRDGSGNVSNIVLGSNLTLTGGVLNATTSGSGYNQIQDDGTNITQRTTLNFVDYFTVTDGSSKTNVSINTAELGADTTLISTLETNMDLANISGQIDLSTQVTGTLSSTNIDITDLESNLDLANIAGQIDLTTQVTGLLSPTNIDVVALANDATFISNLEPNLDLANLGGQIDLTSQVTGVLPLANGGTGQALTDPNYDAVYVWDNTTNTTRLAQLSGLSYNSGTNTLASTSSGSNTAINFWIPDTDFGFSNAHKVNMCVNSNDPTRSILLFEADGGNLNNFDVKMATIGTSGNYNTKTVLTLSTISNEFLNMGIDDNYIWVIDINPIGSIYTISSYTYAGVLVSSTPITAFAAGFLPSTMTIVGNKLWVAEYNAFATTLHEYNITGSTVSFVTSYPLSISCFFGFNLYKDTLSNNNMLFCYGDGTVYSVMNYVTNVNQTVQTTEINSTSGAVTLGNYNLFAFRRPNNSSWLTWSDNNTIAGIKTFASDNLGMGSAFDPQGIAL